MRITRWLFSAGLFLVLAVYFAGQTAQASTVVVGTCKSGVQFATIQAAVNASPVGGTINVCPGTYPEQVTINKNLTVKGIGSGNQNARIITVPNGGLVTNATGIYGDAIQAQVYVTGASVTITGLTTDAANNGGVCGSDPIGIYYQNSSGSITRNSVINDVLPPADAGCQGGLHPGREHGHEQCEHHQQPRGKLLQERDHRGWIWRAGLEYDHQLEHCRRTRANQRRGGEFYPGRIRRQWQYCEQYGGRGCMGSRSVRRYRGCRCRHTHLCVAGRDRQKQQCEPDSVRYRDRERFGRGRRWCAGHQ